MNVQALLALIIAALPCVWTLCPPGALECGGRCIADEYVCDGLPDCQNNEDEKQNRCKGYCRPGATFYRNKYSSRSCVPDWMQILDVNLGGTVACDNDVYRLNRDRADCNGYSECTDERDELNCKSPESCTRTAFFCNDRCRPNYWLCDGVRDCRNVDDEANCTDSNTTRKTSPLTTAIAAAYFQMRNDTVTPNVHVQGDVHVHLHVHVHDNGSFTINTGAGEGAVSLLLEALRRNSTGSSVSFQKDPTPRE